MSSYPVDNKHIFHFLPGSPSLLPGFRHDAGNSSRGLAFDPKSFRLYIWEGQSMVAGDVEIILTRLLGASEEPSIQQLTLYIPNKDRNGRQVKNFRRWIQKAQKVLTIIGRGSTAMPSADGTWLNPENDKVLREKTTILYTYIDPHGFEENVGLLREFLHGFGRETDQGEVVFEFDGRFFRVLEYDKQR